MFANNISEVIKNKRENNCKRKGYLSPHPVIRFPRSIQQTADNSTMKYFLLLGTEVKTALGQEHEASEFQCKYGKFSSSVINKKGSSTGPQYQLWAPLFISFVDPFVFLWECGASLIFQVLNPCK